MENQKRIVTQLPLSSLWDENGSLFASKNENLDRNAVADFLKRDEVVFAVANVGSPLRWVSKNEIYTFWKGVREQIISPSDIYTPDGSMRFRISHWSDPTKGNIILFEAEH